MFEITEEKIKTKQGNGIFYSTIINGEKFVSRIVIIKDNLNKEWLEKWKTKARQEIINKLNENSIL